MKIQLLSDLHLETHPHWKAQCAPGADVLVLAGDIGSYQPGSQLIGADFGLEQFSPLHGWPTPVLFVPGNHEYDGLDFDLAHTRLQETCLRLGITWLEREVVQLQGVRFVGTTLWSDYDALAPSSNTTATATSTSSSTPKATYSHAQAGSVPAPEEPTIGSLLRARDKAFRAANYYLRKTETTRAGQAWLAAEMREQALICQQWLRTALEVPFDGPTVAITHFAPSLLSADPRYGMTPGTAGFCNALDKLLPHAQLWLHGHLHAPSRYTHRGCRVVANPLGYARKNEQASFEPCCVVEV